MNIILHPGSAKGEINAPASKSYSQRAVAAALLADGETVIHNIANCDDVRAALGVVHQLGAEVNYKRDSVRIKGIVGTSGLNRKTEFLNCGESGLCLRMFSSIAALFDRKIELLAEGSLLKRPVNFAGKTMTQLGSEFSANNGFPPVTVKGPLIGGRADVNGAVGSQFLSGLMTALPNCADDSHLTVSDLKSKSYIDITIDTLAQFGVEINHNDYEEVYIRGGQKYTPCDFTVEGDWSGVSSMLVAGAIAGEVTVKGMNDNSFQPDRMILKALESAGATAEIDNNIIKVSKSELRAFEFDATHCPDLFPALTVLAINSLGISRIKGVGRLTNKESNRAAVLTEEFNKLGAKISTEGDYLLIEGGKLTGGTVSSHNDHRIAMALAVAAFKADSSITIQNANCVSKSYLRFYDDLKAVGMKIG